MFVCRGRPGGPWGLSLFHTGGPEDPAAEGGPGGAARCQQGVLEAPALPPKMAAAAATGSVPVRVCHQEIVKFDLEIKAAVQVAPPAEPP